jgi:hypothetical protein
MTDMSATSGRLCGFLAVLSAVVSPCAPAVAADWTHEYTLPLPADQLISYRIELSVDHAGPLVVTADWSSSRVLAFQLLKPGKVPALRKSGPPPLALQLEVTAADAALGEPWTLWVRGLPAREAATGNLVIRLPEPAGAAPAPPADVEEPPPARHVDSWRLPLPSPSGLSGPWAAVYDTTARFRRIAVDEVSRDNFGWHDELLRFLETHRQHAPSGSSGLTEPTIKMLRRMVEAVAKIDDARNSDDPILAGPPPAEPSRRRAWTRLREARLLPLQGELDTLLRDLQRGYAPQVRHETWATRFLSCLIAAQQHFDQFVLDAAPDDVDPLEEQWNAVLAAADVLRALSALPPD